MKSVFRRRYVFKPYLMAFLAGFLLALPLSYPSLFFVSWFGLLPFLFNIKDISGKKVFIRGTIMGTSLIFWSSHWLYYPLIEYSTLPFVPGLIILVFVFILYGMIYGLWASLYNYLKKNKEVSVFLLGISWIALEYLRYILFSELPFGYLAYTQSAFLSLVQMAEYGGIFIVGFILVLFNGYIYKIFVYKKIRYIFPVLIILIFIISIGKWQIINYNNKDYQSIDVGIIQTSLGPSEKWDLDKETNIDNLMNKSLELDGVKLIVWPETALTFDLLRNEYYYNKFMRHFPLSKSHLQVSGHAIIESPMEIYNSSFLVSAEGEILDRYNKMRLVPFGEYFPFVEFMEKFGVRFASQTPGKEISIFELDDFSWRTVICSEILYPYLLQEGILESDFIVTQSVESWYKKGNLQKQMWSAAIFRAVENRRSILKSANMGYGGIISPAGISIIKEHSLDKSTISHQLPLNNEETFYQRHGDYIGFFSLILISIILFVKLLVVFIRKKREK
ncbi:MAG: apolipoprotein N-acyltransferase [Bacillota bacterium]